ncbi:hypothetical protein M2109_000373 [Paenibacillus sp. PastH-3]|nr:hypothetical protein [Paenibacillus sp. PastH-4]MDH6443233.1 hypothetical protein [Paenibacillus sp. PastF-4]MDH6526062.1 hypothetical protein [Paenibacillus sp. PastH-3]
MVTVKNIKAEYLLMTNPNFELFSEHALEKIIRCNSKTSK